MSLPNLTCPQCGGIAVNTATKYGWRSSCCGLWSWKGQPLVDQETHELRKKAYTLIDDSTHWTTKSELHRILSRELKIPPDQCHVQLLDKSNLKRVIEILKPKTW